MRDTEPNRNCSMRETQQENELIDALLRKKTQAKRDLESLEIQIAELRADFDRRMDEFNLSKKVAIDVLMHVEALLQIEGWVAPESRTQGPSLGDFPAPSDPVNAVFALLSEVGRPLHYRVIAEELSKRGMYLPGKNPAATLLTKMTRDDRFARTKSRGTYGLKDWNEDQPASILRGGNKGNPT